MQPIPNSIAALQPELTEWRRDFHKHPELGYEETRTSGIIAEKLQDWGLDAVETGIGKTGVVGVLHGKNGPGRAILLRTDIDALPMPEENETEHASVYDGKMHACGHDGHLTMLLGAAKHMAETRNFDGTVYFCFQPAEEGGAGAQAMIEDGLFERFPAEEVYGMHNWPGTKAGTFAVRPGPVMASADEFNIVVRGQGGHAAQPHTARDPIVAGAQIVNALQTIVSRKVDPLKPAVLSVTKFQAGTAHNIIPDEALIAGTMRSFHEEVADQIIEEMKQICQQISTAMGVTATLETSEIAYPATVNDEALSEFSKNVLIDLVGEDNVELDRPPTMGGEDFAFMARAKPGSFVFIGTGEDVAPLHTTKYDFNDEISPLGVAYWTKLVETALPAA
ncbi:MAG: M20 aminoacylase family protein [Pseudomonadota bacterium]